jgi:hypothetical protein
MRGAACASARHASAAHWVSLGTVPGEPRAADDVREDAGQRWQVAGFVMLNRECPADLRLRVIKL